MADSPRVLHRVGRKARTGNAGTDSGAVIDDEAIILLRAAAGQPRAVEACIERFAPLVWSLARTLLARPQDAEDAVQEAFIAIWQAAPKFDPSIASARAFVAMIARRRIIDRGRSEYARSRRGLTAKSDAIFETFADATRGNDPTRGRLDDEARRLADAVASLRPEQQQTIRLSIGQGWSHQEIADRMGIPLGTVKTNLRRGLQRLREVIEGVQDGKGTSMQGVSP